MTHFIDTRHSENITIELDNIDYETILDDTKAGFKALAEDYLISKLGWVECTKMDGAIFSYNSGTYGHTGVVKDAKNNIVNDANWSLLKVGTHYLNLDAVGARYACPKAMLSTNTKTEPKPQENASTAATAPKPSTPATPAPAFKVGDTVRPLRLVDYDGRRLRQYDDIPVGKLNIRNSDVCKFCGKYDYRYQEKGVDVGLAVDIVKDTLKNRTDKIILASSDTDLVPAILTAMEEGKEVVYAGFGDKLTHALVAKTSSTQTIPDMAIIEAYNNAVS